MRTREEVEVCSGRYSDRTPPRGDFPHQERSSKNKLGRKPEISPPFQCSPLRTKIHNPHYRKPRFQKNTRKKTSRSGKSHLQPHQKPSDSHSRAQESRKCFSMQTSRVKPCQAPQALPPSKSKNLVPSLSAKRAPSCETCKVCLSATEVDRH